jgi:hypothetical protein
MGLSKAGSMKGYKLKIWLKKNKETIKALIVAGVGVSIFFLPQIKDPAWSAGAGSLAAIITKLIADTVDFWISDVEIPEPLKPPMDPPYINP